jgi:hypothetical protein
MQAKVRTEPSSYEGDLPHRSHGTCHAFDGTVRLWDVTSGATLRMLHPDRLYERMNTTGLTGANKAQRAALKAQGAIEWSDPSAPLYQQ